MSHLAKAADRIPNACGIHTHSKSQTNASREALEASIHSNGELAASYAGMPDVRGAHTVGELCARQQAVYTGSVVGAQPNVQVLEAEQAADAPVPEVLLQPASENLTVTLLSAM